MKPIVITLIAILLLSCDSQKVLFRNGKEKNKEYEVGQFNSGCCGCVALYYSLFDGKKVSKQLIFEMSCGMGEPTVFTIINDSKEVQQFVAVSDSTAAFQFTPIEKILLTKLDSIAAAHKIYKHKQFRFADLVGYRRNLAKENFHPFWIDEKGKGRF